MSDKLYLIDGYALVYRSYFAFIRTPLFNPAGRNSSAVFGFFRALFSIQQNYKPGYLGVIFDSAKPTFRHERYPEYKANREKAPQDLHAQIPVIKEILDAMKISRIERDGVEADDIIATYATLSRKNGQGCAIISGDKDLMQLVGDNVTALVPDKSGGYLEYGPSEVAEKWGVPPEGILDYLSMTGDQSDNVPGVKGIGPKGAVGLLEKYGSLDGVYSHLDDLTPRQREIFSAEKENAYLSRELITLKTDLEDLPQRESFRITEYDTDKAAALFVREGAVSLAEQIGSKAVVEEQVGNDSFSADSSEYTAVLSMDQLESLVSAVKEAGTFSLDVETDSLDPMRAELAGISVSVSPGSAWYIPLQCSGTLCLDEKKVRDAFLPLLSNENLVWVGQNLKYDYKVLKRWGIDNITCGIFDTMIAAWLLDSTANTFGMDILAERHLGYRTIHFTDVVPKGSAFKDIPLEAACSYAAEDADITFRLYQFFRPLLEKEGLASTFYDLEMPVLRILGEMEITGIALNGGALKEYGLRLGEELNEFQGKIYELCGKEFNINSTKQLQQILFEERKLTPVKKTKTGYSTDTSVLQQLAEEDPVPEMILRHRGLSKLKSTYVDTLPQEINPETGRIHTSFQQTGTATGRLASKNPNLQNIPVKDEAGREIRRAFIPAPGFCFISADYSQIELVVFAHLSSDKNLSRAFREGKDIHRQTASLIFGISEDDVSPEQRRVAKTINFGVIYGMSPFRLSNELRISRSDAAQFIQAYFNQYSKVREFIDNTIKETEERGYVATMLGHRRTVPGITSRNKTEKAGAERIAVNTPIQGSAADIVKLAMIKLDKALKAGKFRSRLILQVHDELILEVPTYERETVSALVLDSMQNAIELTVPLKVSLETGDSWGSVH